MRNVGIISERVEMSGEKDLDILLGSMDPELDKEEYVFCTTHKNFAGVIEWNPWAMIREKEAVTVILSKESADANALAYESIFKCITLNIHSSLDAVGLTAAVSSTLARSKISANIVAAYFHDHIFIQKEKADMAISLLRELSHSGNYRKNSI